MFSVVPLNKSTTPSFILYLHTYYVSSLMEVLFSHLVTTLNAAFESKLILEYEGHESGSENCNIPTPLRRTSQDTPCLEWWKCLLWSSNAMQHRCQPVVSQTCKTLINLQLLWWWGHLYSQQSFTFQYSTIAEPMLFSYSSHLPSVPYPYVMT